VRQDGRTENLQISGPALGLIANASYRTGQIRLQSGDVLSFYTDGVTETMNENQQQYGEKRLTDLLIQNRNQSAQQIIELILADLNQFSSEEIVQDDRTMLILEVKNVALGNQVESV